MPYQTFWRLTPTFHYSEYSSHSWWPSQIQYSQWFHFHQHLLRWSYLEVHDWDGLNLLLCVHNCWRAVCILRLEQWVFNFYGWAIWWCPGKCLQKYFLWKVYRYPYLGGKCVCHSAPYSTSVNESGCSRIFLKIDLKSNCGPSCFLFELQLSPIQIL